MYERATRPPPEVTDLTERRRVRLGLTLLLAFVPIAAGYLVFFGAVSPDAAGALGSALALVLLLVAAGTLRGRSTRLGMALIIIAPWSALAFAWFRALPDPSLALFYFTVLPLLLAGLLLSPRIAVVVAALHLLALAGLLFAPVREVNVPDGTLGPLLFMATVTPLVLLVGAFQERSARLQEQTNGHLHEAERRRRDLLDVILHDMATPITPIQMQLDLLREAEGDRREYAVIDRNLTQLQRLIKDVRDLARIEAERLSLDMRPTDLAHLVTDAAEDFAHWAVRRRVTPRVSAEPPVPVHVDPGRVNQVLHNLVTNALKFSPPGTEMEVSATADGGVGRVCVRDEGRGLAPEEIPRLFRPFSQVHSREEVDERGTGLGLYISKGIIEAHGGRIWAESDGLGQGAEFGFELPLSPADQMKPKG